MPATAPDPGPAPAAQPPAVDKPKHKLAEMTTYELRTYLWQLKNAVAFFERNPAPVLARLTDALAQAQAEHDERQAIARPARR